VKEKRVKSELGRGNGEEGGVIWGKNADHSSVSKIGFGSYSIKIIRKRVIMPDLSCITLVG
jgi:hypothetical protein